MMFSFSTHPSAATPAGGGLAARVLGPLTGHLHVLASAALCCAATGCATPMLESPTSGVRLMTVAAHGVQIYECRAAEGAAPAWAFVAPQADLFDDGGLRIGRHGAGHSWQHEDGSGFTGTVRSRMASPKPGAIPWLLLDAQAQPAGGSFSRVTAVQRINTVGGQPPDGGCGTATLGRRVHMAYRADYVLYAPAPVGRLQEAERYLSRDFDALPDASLAEAGTASRDFDAVPDPGPADVATASRDFDAIPGQRGFEASPQRLASGSGGETWR